MENTIEKPNNTPPDTTGSPQRASRRAGKGVSTPHATEAAQKPNGDARTAFWRAYQEMQAELEDVQKNHENQAYKSGGKVSTYANLADVLSAARPIWTKHGFAIVQNCVTVNYENEKIVKMAVTVDTIVTHNAGHTEVFSGLEIPVTNPNAHGIASAVTYARRISLMPVLGITGVDDDDDGNTATGNPAATARKPSGDMTAEFNSYKFTPEQMQAMRLANITTMWQAVELRRKYPSNEAMIKALTGEAQ
jgi:hypothetical protein